MNRVHHYNDITGLTNEVLTLDAFYIMLKKFPILIINLLQTNTLFYVLGKDRDWLDIVQTLINDGTTTITTEDNPFKTLYPLLLYNDYLTLEKIEEYNDLDIKKH